TIPSTTIPDPVMLPAPVFSLSSRLLAYASPTPFNTDSNVWITRRSDPDAMPLFDTRTSSLPPTPISPFMPQDERTSLDRFDLVFEDEYLQLTSALPLDANIYGLGEYIASSGFRRDV
ncbi:hypothetical protein K435DRAFT_620953, partial [Dendrothele bispora CBS 962.96]